MKPTEPVLGQAEKLFPVQTNRQVQGYTGTAPECVYMAAYEVYCRVYGPQPALIEGGCRGGFGTGELIAFLYARSFPSNEWSRRIDEALTGLKV